jgi:hypothetical protein
VSPDCRPLVISFCGYRKNPSSVKEKVMLKSNRSSEPFSEYPKLMRDDPKGCPIPREMSEQTFLFHIKNLAGRVLTILDGSLPEGKQVNAIKSLVKKEFREELNRSYYVFHSDNGIGANSAHGIPELEEQKL